jgi:hypothetical protein
MRYYDLPRHLSHKYAGRYKTFEVREIDCPPITERLLATKDSWIADDSGLVAQVIGMAFRIFNRGVGTKVYATTCFGVDCIRVVYQNARAIIPELDFRRERSHFMSKINKKHITNNNRAFLQLVVQQGNVIDAYRTLTGKKAFQTKTAQYMLKDILACQEGKEYFAKLLQDDAKKMNLDKPGYFLEKLDSAVKDGVKSELHLKVLRILAKAGGNQEIINALAEETGMLPPKTFPSDPRLHEAEEVKALPESTEQLKT